MTPYEYNLLHVLQRGTPRTDRTGVGTIGVFGCQTRYNLATEFPCITSKRIHWKAVVGELRWILSGSTNVKDLQAMGVTIWDEWADPVTGELGPVYGKQWRNFNGVDQIKWVVDEIRRNPDSRRLIVSAWNPGDVPDMALPPCHTLFQFYVQDGKLSCQLYQRSADMFLGVPFNVASYALLTHMVARCCGLEVGLFIHTIGDAHIYSNHVEQVRLQLERAEFEPKPLPTLKLTGEYQYPWEYTDADIELVNYKPHPTIKAPVAV